MKPPQTTMCPARRSAFNMIEVALALGIVAIGVISIMALFPIGLAASRDAIAEGHAADAGAPAALPGTAIALTLR